MTFNTVTNGRGQMMPAAPYGLNELLHDFQISTTMVGLTDYTGKIKSLLTAFPEIGHFYFLFVRFYFPICQTDTDLTIVLLRKDVHT